MFDDILDQFHKIKIPAKPPTEDVKNNQIITLRALSARIAPRLIPARVISMTAWP